ncbi:MAG: OPT/YSL family transporter [Planctomycetales bacterium]
MVSALFARRGKSSREQDHLAAIEIPTSWFVIGILIPGAICVWMGHQLLPDPLGHGHSRRPRDLFSLHRRRPHGRDRRHPIGAMGKITQLLYGVIAPSNMVTNIMTASITSGAASHSADLLTDLKTGYLLGGNPRKQTISQLFGVLAGTIVVVPVYLMVVKLDQVGTDALPMPSAQVWKGSRNWSPMGPTIFLSARLTP